MCKGKCTNTVKVEEAKRGAPAIDRSRRSINNTPKDKNVEKLSVMVKLSRSAGCSGFVQALKKFGMLKKISNLMKQGKHVAIFCPVDKAFWKVYGHNRVSVDKVRDQPHLVQGHHLRIDLILYSVNESKRLFTLLNWCE